MPLKMNILDAINDLKKYDAKGLATGRVIKKKIKKVTFADQCLKSNKEKPGLQPLQSKLNPNDLCNRDANIKQESVDELESNIEIGSLHFAHEPEILINFQKDKHLTETNIKEGNNCSKSNKVIDTTNIENHPCNEYSKQKYVSKIHDENYSYPSMNNHMYIYVCQYCRKVCKSQRGLTSHVNIAHSNLLIWKCTVCHKICNTMHDLKRHIALHSGKKNYFCHVCNKAFSSKGNLLIHEKSQKHIRNQLVQLISNNTIRVNENFDTSIEFNDSFMNEELTIEY